MPMGDSDTQPDIVVIGERRSELGVVEDWSMNKGGKEREILNNQTI